MASYLPASSLRLLIPPLRLLTAAMWQVARHQSVKHYGMLEDFVSLVTEAVPQLLTDSQRSVLLLALRTKVTLSDPADVHTHLDRIRSVSQATLDEDVDDCCAALSALASRLTETPDDTQSLLQDVFNQSFDSALQSLISDFLSRIEQLFPVPDFRQAASWLDATPVSLDDCLREADRKDLRELLTNQSCRRGQSTTAVGCDAEKTLLSAWSHPLLTKLTNPTLPPSDTAGQSDVPPAEIRPLQLDVELVKVEVVVITEEEQEEVEETVIGQTVSLAETDASNQSEECSVVPVILDEDRYKDSPANLTGQSDHSGSEVPASALHSISHNAQRVAHRCPQCGKCFIYRSQVRVFRPPSPSQRRSLTRRRVLQVIRHLRTNRSCGAGCSITAPVEPRPLEPRPLEPRPLRTHSCFQCNAIFKNTAELLTHQRSHRARPVYQCSQCDKAFRHLSSLTNHKQTHLDKGGFTDSRCDQVFESAKERDGNRPDLVCTVCSQSFSSQTLLLRHLQTHSAEGAELCYNCRFCDQSFSGVTQLRIHQRTHTFRSYQCDQCSKTYSSLTGLQSHRASHSSDSRFLCPQCGKRFKTRDGLEGHLRTHTGERPFRCPYCPKDFTALAGLNVHVRRHTGERPYVCTVCGKGWPSGGDLQKHMRIHTGERPYVCQDCGKAFSISCHLTEHRRIHTGEKPFTCPECGKCLRRKFDLKKHMLSHSNIRPYACTFCSKSYTRKTHLTRHLLTHGVAGGEAEATAEEP